MEPKKPDATDKVKDRPADIAGRVRDKPSYERTDEDAQRNYGFGRRAGTDPQGEVTKRREYSAEGLPEMDKYSVDKVGRPHLYGSVSHSAHKNDRVHR